MNDLQLLSARQVREIFSVSPMTLWRWRQRDDFPQPARIGNRLYWRQSDVAAWQEQQFDTAA